MNVYRNQYTSGPSGAFEAPPSTMATQLINNLATANRTSRAPEQDDLKRLMSEVSDMENRASELSNPDDKLEHKHKLIYVFARAVLERLSSDDPFMNTSQLVSQAVEALDIFMSAVREAPAVLSYVLNAGEVLQARGQEPLWNWLFPRILTLLGRREYDALTEKIKDFFYVCFQVVSRSPKLWNLNHYFFYYLKECASSTYHFIHGLCSISSLLVYSYFGRTSKPRYYFPRADI